MATAAPAGTARGGRAAEGGAALARLGCGGGRKGEPRWRFLKLRGFLAPTGAMVSSQGLPAPGPRFAFRTQGLPAPGDFPVPLSAENKRRNIKTGASGGGVSEGGALADASGWHAATRWRDRRAQHARTEGRGWSAGRFAVTRRCNREYRRKARLH